MARAGKSKGGDAGSRTEGKAFAVLGWLALLVILPAGLYVAHVVRQSRENEVRNLRLLAQAAGRVETVLRGSIENLNKLGTLDGEQAEAFFKRTPPPYPYLLYKGKWEPSDDSHFTLDDSHFTLKEEERGAGRLKLFLYHRAGHFEVDLADILTGLPLDREPRPFEQLVLVDGDGKVILQHETETGTSPAFRLMSLQGVVERDGPKESQSIEALGFGPFHDTVPLAGADTHLLCQPLEVRLLGESETESAVENVSWALCGLAGESGQLRRALGVAPQLGLVLFLTIVYLIFAWPFIKLFLMDRHERFHLWDGYLLFISTFACLSLTTVLLVDHDTYAEAGQAVESELENLAGQVEDRLKDVTGVLIGRLERYDRLFDGRCSGKDRQIVNRRASCAFTHLLSEDTGLKPEAVEQDDSHIDGLTSIFWMDENGDQLHKGSVFGKNTPFVNLAHREYFRAVRDDNLWRHWEQGREPERVCSRFFLQPLRSFTTGEREVVLSCGSTSVPEAIAVALTAAPDPLLRAVLPPGFEFAVVDLDGKVLFHSDPLLALQEKLFDEVSDLPRIRAAIDSGAEVHFSAHYQTRPYSIHGRPLEHFPWYVVTFYELEVLRTVNLEALGHTTLVALPYVLLMGLVLLVLGVWLREAHWFWPDKERTGLYWSLCAVFAAALAMEFVFLVWGGGDSVWPFLLIPIVTLAAVIAGFARFGKRRKESRVIEKPRLYHVAGLLLWLAIAVLPSLGFFQVAWLRQMESLTRYEALGFAQTLHERDRWIEDTAKNIKWRSSRQTELRRTDLLDVYSGGEGETPSIFRPAVCLEGHCGGGHVHEDDSGDSSRDSFQEGWGRLARRLPIYNRSSEGLRYQATLRADHRDGRWHHCEQGFCLRLSEGGSERANFVLGFSAVKQAPDFLGLGLVVGVLLGTVLLVIWIRWAAKHLFALVIPGQYRNFELSRFESLENCVIAHVADPRQYQELVEAPSFDRIDLAVASKEVEEEVRSLKKEQKRAERQEKDTCRPVLCSGFETGIGAAEARHWKLAQLEHIVFQLHRKVILPTVWNPFEQLFAVRYGWPAGAAGEESSELQALSVAGNPVPIDAAEAERWGHLFSNFDLWPIPLDLRKRQHECDPEKIKQRMEDKEGFYWALWTACSDDERMTLMQVTEEHFLNPKQLPTVRGLLQRNLMLRRPDLRPYDECFEAFIERMHEPEDIRQAVLRWERGFEGMGWRQLRWALVSVLAVLGLFLTAVAPELLDATIGYLSAIAVVPAVLKLLVSVRHSGTQGSGS